VLKRFPVKGKLKIAINLQPKFPTQLRFQLPNLTVSERIVDVAQCVHDGTFKAVFKDCSGVYFHFALIAAITASLAVFPLARFMRNPPFINTQLLSPFI
jgi:hypothetical protein